MRAPRSVSSNLEMPQQRRLKSRFRWVSTAITSLSIKTQGAADVISIGVHVPPTNFVFTPCASLKLRFFFPPRAGIDAADSYACFDFTPS
ncbi:hypothetical protein BIW11_02950 [Tropilaelaps mercedesae]|uniref:Uncharacterized protein n=1 Tax=Tropilaelaps mercedesae TaxID=418985 RepID=A0A1V9XUR8_9ACAR|nr:hypothetical protein BIW11_02950 [Tropilaelaps mercedesae]